MLTAATVALTGPIGFVGLVVPHLIRTRIGADHRVLMPCAFLGGGVLLAELRRDRARGHGAVGSAGRSGDGDSRRAVSGLGPATAVGASMRARPLFIGGTSSNAGKSWMATAICAWLRSRGVSVAPFKAQNMSNNSYPCRAGGEIGRAQVAQAEACGLEPEPAMNPILLKPSGNGTSQVVVNGRVWKTLSAREYYAHADELRGKVLDAYEDLASRFEVIVIEGAGSVTELNLRDHDLVNLGLVTSIRAPWLLVADIERGGVFGSVIGTTTLLTADERSLFRGFAINKFRGDVSLFEEGVRILEERTASHCFGVFPYAPDIHLDAEDSLALETRSRAPAPPGARIAIVRLPHLSNATDFRLLTWADWVASTPQGEVRFCHPAGHQEHDRRPRVAPPGGTGGLDCRTAPCRHVGHWHLRWVSDARTERRRSGGHRIGHRVRRRPRPAAGDDDPDAREAHACGSGDHGGRRHVRRL